MVAKKSARWLTLAVSLAASAAMGQTTDWINPLGGGFNNSSNWDNGVPLAGGDANFSNNYTVATSGYTVSFATDVTNDVVIVANDDVTFNLGGRTYTNSNLFYGVQVGEGGSATLSLQNGVLTDAAGQVAVNYGDTATVNVGAGATWNNSSELLVGYGGTGILNIANGGIVTSLKEADLGLSTSSGGTVSIDGAGSQWTNDSYINIGQDNGAQGILTITHGGTFNNTGLANLVTSGSVTVDGAGSVWNNSGTILMDGGSITVSNGGIVNDGGYSVGNSGRPATVTVTGAGSQLNYTSGGSYFDKVANGTLNIQNGATSGSYGFDVGTGGTTGTVNVDGTGSTWNVTHLAVGADSAGMLNITNGAVVNAGTVLLGTDSNSSGSIDIDGASSKLNATSIGIAYGGSESPLSITNGAMVTTTGPDTVQGGFHGGAVTIDGTGSRWNSGGEIDIGANGNGTIIIKNGGALSDSSATLGENTGPGAVTVQDDNSTWTTSGNVSVGGSTQGSTGAGIINISGGTVTLGGTLKIFYNTNTSVTLSGGTLNVGTLSPTDFTHFIWNGGTLNISGSTLVLGSSGQTFGPSLTLNPGMTLSTSGNGAIALSTGAILNLNGGSFPGTNILTASAGSTINLNTGTFTRTTSQTISSIFTNHGTVAGPTVSGQSITFAAAVSGTGSFTGNIGFNNTFSPGDSGPAMISLANGTFGSSSTLQLELDSISSMDHLNFSGTATLGGTLAVTLGNSFVPASGQNFELIDGAITGTFATLNLPSLSAGLAWNTTQLYASGIISVGPINQWASAVNGNFNDPTKWSDGYAPIATDVAIFNTGSSSGYTVTFTNNASADYIQVANDTVTLDLAGNSFSLLNTGTTTPSLLVGVGGKGILSLKSSSGAGALSTVYAALGQSTGDTGTVNIADPNFSWTVSKTLSIGGSSTTSGGTGILNISNGTVSAGTLQGWSTKNSAINLSGGILSVGTLNLDGTPSLLNWTGGTLQISSATVTVSFTGNLPDYLQISPRMTLALTGANATFVINTSGADAFTLAGGNISLTGSGTPSVEIGTSVGGTLDIDAGTFSDAIATVAYALGTTSTTTVQSSYSKWTNSTSLTLGGKGNGSLYIKSGGTVTAATNYIAASGGALPATGSVTVDGAGSQWTTAGGLYDGQLGTGSLTISNGGYVSDAVAYLGYGTSSLGGRGLGPLSYSSGTVTIADATSDWNTSGSVYIGGNSTTDEGSGTLNINGGTVTIGGTLKIWKPANSSTKAIVNLAGGTLNVGTLDITSTPADFNWTGGALNLTNSDLHIGSTGLLGPLLTLSNNMNLQVTGSTHALIVDNNGTLTNNGYILASNMNIAAGTYLGNGTIQIQNGAFTAGNQSINGYFINSGTVAGPTVTGQFLTLAGPVSGDGAYTGNIALNGQFITDNIINNGTLQVNCAALTGQIIGSGNLVINDSLQLAGVSGISQQGDLTLNGTLDIQENGLAINYAANGYSDPIASIKSFIASAYDHGLWDGPGLTSITVANNPGTAIGYADGSTDTGTAAPSGTVLVMFTWLGDLNLDYRVDSSDLAIMTANIGVTNADWAHGDINYDGTVNADDFALLSLGIAASHGDKILFPEPSVLAPLALIEIILRRRRPA